ncbi:hypothetical protein DH2020_013381 [Rehmannia glutinosa]|uniref:Uncharacterized protein n=1 Tax=Rehmannia glutinosa TaxID=99300 RepID=A0ABR0X262_REHGL
MLNSQCLFLATAMAVSAGTIILFDLFRDRNQDSNLDEKQVLKSCLSSDDVKDSRISYGRKLYKKDEIQKICCGNENLGFKKMPANRVALYSGILRDRVQKMEYSC